MDTDFGGLATGVAITVGLIGLGQAVLRLLVGPSSEIRELCAKLLKLFAASMDGDIPFKELRSLQDEIELAETHSPWLVRRHLQRIAGAAEDVEFTYPLRFIDAVNDQPRARPRDEQEVIEVKRHGACMRGQHQTYKLLQMCGRFDRWIIGR